MNQEKRQRCIISMPISFWAALDNIQNPLINSRGDAVIFLIMELQKHNPSVMDYIPRTEPNPNRTPEGIQLDTKITTSAPKVPTLNELIAEGQV